MTDDLLAGMDAPRPLPDGLRARLEEQLLGAAARPLDADLDARLAARMTDPVAGLLDGLDAPRALMAAQRGRLEQSLIRRRRAPWLAAAAAAVLLVGGGALLLGGGQQDHQLATSPASSHPPTGPVGAGTTGGSGGTTGSSGSGPAGVVAPGPVKAADPVAGGAQAQQGPPQEYDAAKSVNALHVTPSSGPPSGGTVVRLTGGDLRTVVEVRFGDRAGSGIVVHADGTVTVRTPAAVRAGTVDVTARSSDGRRVVAAQAFSYRAR